jgi:hypothetical protein
MNDDENTTFKEIPCEENGQNRLEDFISQEFKINDIDALTNYKNLLIFYPLLNELTKVSENDFLVRISIVGEMARSEHTYWDKGTLDRVFSWIRQEKREYLISSLRNNQWLDYDRDKGYYLTDSGRTVNSILNMLTGLSQRPEDYGIAVCSLEYCINMDIDPSLVIGGLRSKLEEITRRIEEALNSHSQVIILKAQEELDLCLHWSKKTREVLSKIDPSVPINLAEVNSIHRNLSLLHNYRSELERSLTDIGRQFISLEGRITLIDITDYLMKTKISELGEVAREAVSLPIKKPIFLLEDSLISLTEAILMRNIIEEMDVGWGSPEFPMEITPAIEEEISLKPLFEDLKEILENGLSKPLSEVVPRDSKEMSFYRLSMLPLLGEGREGEERENIYNQFKRLPLDVNIESENMVKVNCQYIHEVSDGKISTINKKGGEKDI